MRLAPAILASLCACSPPPDVGSSPATSATADTAVGTCGGAAPAITEVQAAPSPEGCASFVVTLDDADGDLSPAVLWAWHDDTADGEVVLNVDAERVELPFPGGACRTQSAEATVQFCPQGTLGIEWAFLIEDAAGLRSPAHLYAESR